MKEYRQDAHAGPLTLWAVLCGAAAAVLLVHGVYGPGRPPWLKELLIAAALILFGPLALALYLYRARHVRVAVDPGRGIVVSGGRVIPWDRIDRVEHHRPSFRRTTGPVKFRPWTFGALDRLARRAESEGVLLGFALAFLALGALAVFWLVFAAVVPLFVVPVLEVLAPFGDRVRVVAEGHGLVLRDLNEADEFIRELGARVPVVEA